MLKPLLMLLGLAFVSSAGFAATGGNAPTTFCSGIQTSSSSSGSPLALSCAGDFSLSGGVLSNSVGLFLSSTGALTLDNISITAPTLSFAAGSLFSMTPSVSISAVSNVSISANTIALNGTIAAPGGAISIVSFSSVFGSAPSISGGNLSLGSSGILGGGNLSLGNGGTLLIGGGINLVPNQFMGSVVPGGTLSITPVPEPSSYITLLVGLLCFAGFQRMSRHKKSNPPQSEGWQAGHVGFSPGSFL